MLNKRERTASYRCHMNRKRLSYLMVRYIRVYSSIFKEPGRMELVDEEVHKKSGHLAWKNFMGGGNNNR